VELGSGAGDVAAAAKIPHPSTNSSHSSSPRPFEKDMAAVPFAPAAPAAQQPTAF